MKVYELGAQDGIDSLRLATRTEPAPGPGEAVVEFHANSLNYRDYMIVARIHSGKKPEERIPLSDGAGEVIAVGEGVKRVKPGDRVVVSFFTGWIDGQFGEHYFGTDLGGGCDGTLAEQGVFPAEALAPIPDCLSYEEAACLPCAALTAWNALVEFARLKPGDTVLLLGTGGVSVFGLQFARLSGARAIVTSSSDAKLARAKELGADALVNYKTTPAWGEAVRELTGGRGADVVLETGGSATLEQSIDGAASNARIGLIGVLGGVDQTCNPIGILWKNIHLKGIYVGNRRMLEDMMRTMASGSLKPVIDKAFAFDEAKAAYHHLASGTHFGKVVIARG